MDTLRKKRERFLKEMQEAKNDWNKFKLTFEVKKVNDFLFLETSISKDDATTLCEMDLIPVSGNLYRMPLTTTLKN